MSEEAADADAPQEWSEPMPTALEAIWSASALLREKGDVIAEKMKVRRKVVLEKAQTLEKAVTRIVMALDDDKRRIPGHTCKDFASEGYIYGDLLKVAIDDPEEFERVRGDVMAGMSGRRLTFEIESVEEIDKDLMVEGWRKALEDITALRERLAA